MAKEFSGIDARLAEFIRGQHVFFVATAPTGATGHINLSPKGLDAFRILDSKTVAYLDLTGSGIETVAHLRDNGRITILFCAFDGPPKILRLQGRGEAIAPGDPRFATLRGQFPPLDGARTVIRIMLDRIADSCGYGVPRYQYQGERSQLLEWAGRKGRDGLQQYQAEHNTTSIDGLPGLRR
jgi:hypothetical protein